MKLHELVSVVSCDFLAPHAGCPRGDPAWIVLDGTFGWFESRAFQNQDTRQVLGLSSWCCLALQVRVASDLRSQI